MTQRIAFIMTLKPGCAQEYERRHQAVWPSVLSLLKASGISHYSIFLDEENNQVIGIQSCAKGSGSQALGQSPIVREWWAYMADLMETNPDLSPRSRALKEVFFLE